MAPVSLRSELEAARHDARDYRKTAALALLVAGGLGACVPVAWSCSLDWLFPALAAGLALGVAAGAELRRWGVQRRAAGRKAGQQRRQA